MDTRFWLIRHALVAENERVRLYGIKDVPLCPQTLVAQVPMYRTMAALLPQDAVWGCTPLQRTRKTAEAIFAAGYPAQELMVVDGLIEQNLGELQGLDREEVPARLTKPVHPFWPLDPDEVPPGGGEHGRAAGAGGVDHGRTCGRARRGDVVIVSHGGAIRGAVGHAMGVDARAILHLAIQNVSLTRLDRVPEGWRVDCVNYLVSG